MNRYGIVVNTAKSELEQISQLRTEHLRQYPSIIMKNPDFIHLRNFILLHPLNQNDMMRKAPDKIKVLNVMKGAAGFEYAQTTINSYVIGYNSFNLQPHDFIIWLVNKFPRNFDWSLKQCKNEAVSTYIAEQTSWMTKQFEMPNTQSYRFDIKSAEEILNKTRAYCIINNIYEFPKCATCGKRIITNVKSVFDGFRSHCDESCAAGDPTVLSKIETTCNKSFKAKTYLGSDEGIRKKKQRLFELYGDEQYSRTDEWKGKVEAASMALYGTKWPTQCPEIRKRISNSNKKVADANVAKGLKTKKQKRGGKFWTDDELKRIADGNKSPKNQAKRLKRAKIRRMRYYHERLMANAYIVPLFAIEDFTCIPYKMLSSTDLTWECKKCGTVFDAPLCVFYTDGMRCEKSKTYARCPQCFPNRRKSSLEEFHVKEFINSILPKECEIIYGKYENFKIIKPFQLDIIIKEKTSGSILFAVEFDGVRWHSVEMKGDDVERQLRKTIRCEELGIPLVHVFEDEWLYDAERTKDLLRTYMSGEFKNLKFGEGWVSVDRSKFCKAVLIPGYRLVGETPPEVIERKGLECFGQNVYKVPDCGKLIYERIGT